MRKPFFKTKLRNHLNIKLYSSEYYKGKRIQCYICKGIKNIQVNLIQNDNLEERVQDLNTEDSIKNYIHKRNEILNYVLGQMKKEDKFNHSQWIYENI